MSILHEDNRPLPTDLRVLLIQVRDVEEVARHERECIKAVSGLTDNQMDHFNVVHEPDLTWDRVAPAHAIIIGGAGVHSAVNDDPFTPGLLDLVRRMADERVPVFGSCWGHQFIARALGGSVIHDAEHAEVGAHTVNATPEAAGDPILGRCPRRYAVLMGHYDRVERLPDSAVELAKSDLCPNQAFRIEGLPMYGAQFHVELDPTTLLDRLSRYRQYCPDDGEYERIKRGLRPTPEAKKILRRFLHAFARDPAEPRQA